MKNYIILLLFIPNFVFAQNEGNIWYFGYGAGLDFNSGTAVAISGGQINTLEGCASISDNNGDLLFYTDGMTVYNKTHTIMANGTGLLGLATSTQTAIIVKKPQSSTIYYIFTVDGMSGAGGGLCYSEVDLTLNGGLGAVTSVKNIELFANSAEKITAISHDNGTDIWIVAPQHTTNIYFSYLVTNNGISTIPTQSFQSLVADDVGYLVSSPDGSKIGSAFYLNNYFELLEFDNSTGIITPQLQIPDLNYPYSLAFSSNNNVLYISINGDLLQYNLLAENTNAILNSAQSVASLTSLASALQLAPDGAIYHVNLNTSYLSRINSPNSLGFACNYVVDVLQLTENAINGLGLPTFYNSIFNSPFDVFSTNFCYGDSTEFSINTYPDSMSWDFGDTNSGINNISNLFTPSHQFSTAGVYTVFITAYHNNFTTVENETITINAPSVNLGNDTTLCNGASILLEVNNNNATFLWQDLSTSNTFSTSSEGEYWVEIIEFNCPANDSIFINVINLDVNLGNDTILCSGEELLLDATTDSVLYFWHDLSTDSILLASEDDVYWVEISQSICNLRDSINITINPLITASISGGYSFCEGIVQSNAQIITSGLGPFTIEYSNGSTSETLFGEEPFYINIVQEGTYSLLNIVGANNCLGTVFGEENSLLVPNPTADFYMESNEVFIDDSEIIFENYSLDQTLSNWFFGDGNSLHDNSQFISHIYSNVETYYIELIVQNEFGCADTTFQFLTVKPFKYFVPNAFTPNDQNNINDSFGLVSDKIQSIEMMIFDRWGAMVYESDEIENQWDGTVNGVDAQSGVYNYKIIVEDPLGIIHKLSGFVSLIN